MRFLLLKLQALYDNSQGATAIEYGLLAALLGVALVSSMNGMGNVLKTTFNTTSSSMSAGNAAA